MNDCHRTLKMKRSPRAATSRARVRSGHVVLLTGDLGAGKTAFVSGIAEGLGIDPAEVTSPTFTLVQEYSGGRLPLYHVDLYRLQTIEVDDLGLEETDVVGRRDRHRMARSAAARRRQTSSRCVSNHETWLTTNRSARSTNRTADARPILVLMSSDAGPIRRVVRQLHRHDDRVVRLLSLRHRRGAGVQPAVLSERRSADRHAVVVRHLRGRLSRPPARRHRLRPLRRPDRPQVDARQLAA